MGREIQLPDDWGISFSLPWPCGRLDQVVDALEQQGVPRAKLYTDLGIEIVLHPPTPDFKITDTNAQMYHSLVEAGVLEREAIIRERHVYIGEMASGGRLDIRLWKLRRSALPRFLA